VEGEGEVAAASPACERKGSSPIASVYELHAPTQIGNTCAPSVLLLALGRLYSDKKNAGYPDIDPEEIDKDSGWIEAQRDKYDNEGRIHVFESVSLITDKSQHQHQLDDIIKTVVDTEVRHESNIPFGLIVCMVSAAEMDAGCYGNGPEQEVARAKIFHWIYLEVSVSTGDDGAFKAKVLFADTQNGMEQGRKRRQDVRRAADALATAVSDELLVPIIE
jgi:hypothetical protein